MVGGNAPNLFGNTAWALVQDEFNKKMGKNFSVQQIKNEYYMLRSRYQEIMRFMSMGGLSWDPNEKSVVVDDKRVWDVYVKENPDEACYKTLSCPIYEDLSVLFGDLVATKSHAVVENNNVPHLQSKQASSVFNGGKEVGGSANAECNDWGKRTAPSTSKCGATKKAAINISVSIDATGRNYVSATDLQDDPYSIPNCTKLVQSLEGFAKRMVKKYWIIDFQR
ncbi:hypothetical protein MKW94_027155, partial [Papaver nudicaule]|nr:hypothetical protein [Papaver nudicaule]